MLYAVCTHCSFLRAFSSRARGSDALERCPVCGGELAFQERAARFEPTYVSRTALDLHAVPPLERPDHSDPPVQRGRSG